MPLPAPRNPRTFVLVLLACLALSLVSVAYPLYVIRPFRHQGAAELAAALVVARFRPAITVMSALAAALALIGYWRLQARIWKRILPSAGALLAIVLAFLARVNIFEIMFHPNPHPSFVAASGAKLDAAEKVIAVRMGKDARAYPIRSMSYHHIVNDVLDGAAIVATY
jgi:hypothetical protein